jgi:hypothetical protein
VARTNSTHGDWALPAAPYGIQRRKLQQTAFTQLRPLSDTSQCLTANLNSVNQLWLAPCAAPPEQNFTLPAAGQILNVYVGPGGTNKSIDLHSFNTAPGAVVVVGAAITDSCPIEPAPVVMSLVP